MSVERRYRSRQPINIRVHIRYRNRRFYSGRALNLSTDGMYLEVQSVTLPTGTLVELELDSCGRDRLVPAVVVHAARGGIGVMFRDPQTELFRELMRTSGVVLPPRPGVADSLPRSYP
jgi:hypothetical protein